MTDTITAMNDHGLFTADSWAVSALMAWYSAQDESVASYKDLVLFAETVCYGDTGVIALSGESALTLTIMAVSVGADINSFRGFVAMYKAV